MKRLVIFNIEMNKESKFLSANIDLVDSFSRYFDHITVYATHVGVFDEHKYLRVIELGGGNRAKRIKATFKLSIALFRIIYHRNDTVVFYHMVTRVPSVFGKYLKNFGVRQYLWYSHSVADKNLGKVLRYVDLVFSPTTNSFPLVTKKLVCVGHGVKGEGFPNLRNKNRKGVITVGRVVPIKRITNYVNAFSSLAPAFKERFTPLVVVGDFTIDTDYFNTIKNQAVDAGLEVQFVGQVPRSETADFLNKANFYFLGTPKSIDKASIEAAMCGCIILSENLEAVSILGPEEFLEKEGPKVISLNDQLLAYGLIPEYELAEIQLEISELSKTKNDLDKVVDRIVKKLNDN
jgi:glycosyltransferase involved in cell wall biosynthesis